ncbi:MAG: hypothetical protein K8U57_19550 [Planctomycetes bacterium]|nr:hypothetical protein [Planctomycetota bacterium]
MRSTLLALLAFVVVATPAQPSDWLTRTPPERFDIPELPQLARIADVKAMFDEVALPPVPFSPTGETPARFPYTAERLKHYGPDGTIADILKDREKYPLRATVLHALEILRKVPTPGNAKGPMPIITFEAPVDGKLKRTVEKTQDFVAVLVAELETELELMVDVAKLRADEPRRWQAHYDYTLAQLRRRLVFVHEYNKLLGDIRTESLRSLPDGSTGWRLAPAERLRSQIVVKKVLDQSTEGFKAIATEFKGTPWEVLAERALMGQPGLVWEPIVK